MTAIELARKIGFYATQFLLALITLEVCARIDDKLTWEAPLFGDYSQETLFVTDALGYHLRPGGRFQKWEINSHGFRGPEVTLDKPPGLIRVVTVGASETFGLYESPRMEYPAQLQSLLDAEHPGRYQVLNAGIPGISPSRIGNYFEKWLRKFSPDIVIYYPTPSFIMEAETAPAAGMPLQQHKSGFRLSLRLAARLRDLYKRVAPISVQTEVRAFLIWRAVRRHPPTWIQSSVPPEKVKAFMGELAELARQVRASGSQIVFATHASRIVRGDTDEERALLIAARKQSPRRTERCHVEAEARTNEAVLRLAEEHDIPVVDINAAIPKSSEYFADYSHFTDQGAAIAAKAFKAKILELGASPAECPR